MTLRDLTDGELFRFLGSDYVWEYRGQGWYGQSYDGGPWHAVGSLPVELIGSIPESIARDPGSPV